MRGDMMFSGSGHAGDDGQRPALRRGGRGRLPGPAGGRLCGDGGFTMLMGEMATLVKYKLPVKVIVIKNNTLGQIKWEQMVFEGNPRVRRATCSRSTSPPTPRPAARPASRSTTRPRPRTCCGEAFAQPGPAVVEAVVDPNEPPMPGHVTMKQAVALRRGAGPRREGPLGHHQDRPQEQGPRGGLSQGPRAEEP